MKLEKKFLWLGLALFLLGAFLTIRSCRLPEGAQVWKAKYEEQKKAFEGAEKTHLEAIGQKDEKINELQGHIDSQVTVIVQVQGEVEEKNKSLERLKADREKIRGDKDKEIVNLEGQVKVLEDKVSLLEGQLARIGIPLEAIIDGQKVYTFPKDSLVASILQQKQFEIEKGGEYKALYLGEKGLRINCETRATGLESELKRQKTISFLTKVLWGAIGYGAGTIFHK